MPPWIAESSQKNIQFHRSRVQSPDSTAIQALHAMRSFKMAMYVNRLIEIKPPIKTPAQGVQNMVGIFRAEPG
jgi:hypothetical protein